jgi:hypothetical protein
MTYKRQQWIESFEGQLSILRPHLGQRVLSTMNNQAWHTRRGKRGSDQGREGVVGGAGQAEEVASARIACQYQ